MSAQQIFLQRQLTSNCDAWLQVYKNTHVSAHWNVNCQLRLVVDGSQSFHHKNANVLCMWTCDFVLFIFVLIMDRVECQDCKEIFGTYDPILKILCCNQTLVHLRCYKKRRGYHSQGNTWDCICGRRKYAIDYITVLRAKQTVIQSIIESITRIRARLPEATYQSV